ncbi:MAG TPA: heme-binding protein [Terracidiphilus sp.]|nr:heme-binding protein [Terracidiphilus sp.]HUX27657.1 heme-binding protein [Terracidiphilus sp.]
MQRPKLILRVAGLICAAVVLASSLHAQQPVLYGNPIPLAKAKAVAAAALAEAGKNGWLMAVTVVGPSGELVFFEKMDGTQIGSIDLSMAKARSAVLFKRPTKVFEDAVAAGGSGVRILKIPGAMPVDGGVPIVENGKIVGAVGVSGGQSSQDGQCANAAALVH